jgi:acyl-CoA thioesterase
VTATADQMLPIERVRPFDRALLGLEPDPDDPRALSLVVTPSLCRVDGRFYGGAALAAALTASEAATGRDALWSSTQLVGVADLGERIRIDVEHLAAGRRADQVQVRGTIGDRVIFNAVGSAATPDPGGMHGAGQAMPIVPPPEDCPAWRASRQVAVEEARAPGAPAIGHNLVCEHRDAPLLDAVEERAGRMTVWTRFTGPLQATFPHMTPAGLGFVADLVPLAVARACGVDGAGTSLDNSLRIGEPVDSEWVLLDVEAHVAVGGFGHGHVHVWSPDGRMVATGTQSARLFSLEDFVRKQSGSAPKGG